MKRSLAFIFTALLLLPSLAAAAQFISGSTGADGAFSPISNTVLPVPANGVFNFTTVNIPSGVVVSFVNSSANTPVYMLATGDVTIVGTLNVAGGIGNGINPGIGGPGGFSGGSGGINDSGGYGLGTTGGAGGWYNSCWSSSCPGAGGTFSTPNVNLIPLSGGSGGGGGAGEGCSGGGGGGGGGAILIASSGTVTVTGSIIADGGRGASSDALGTVGCDGGGGGAGGAVKITATTITGNGTITANGGLGGAGYAGGTNGGQGAIRFETYNMQRTANTVPNYSFGSPGLVFPPNLPALAITSIGGVSVPSNAAGLYNSPDITLPADTTNPVSIGVSASNIPVGTVITISVIPQNDAKNNFSSTPLAGTLQSSSATANVDLSFQYTCIITASVTYTVQTAMNYNGEKIKKVMVASTMGGKSQVTYITESGKKIPAEKLMASLLK